MYEYIEHTNTAYNDCSVVHSSLQHQERHCHGRHHPHTLADYRVPLAIEHPIQC